MNSKKLSLVMTLVLGVVFGACGGDDGIDPTMTKEEARAFRSADWGYDVCEQNGWYGDGECDTFCPLPDPGCEEPRNEVGSWTTVLLADVESEHPYHNNTERTWTVHREGAAKIKLHIKWMEVERNYDSVSVYIDGQEHLGQVFDGVHNDVWTREFDSDTVYVTMRSDYIITLWGFEMDLVSYHKELDPCAGVVCDDPPSQCHKNPGTCVDGSCQYDPITACIDSDGCCPPGCAGQDDDCPAQSSWDGAYGGSGYDRAESIQQTSDGGYILAGETKSFGASSGDAWVLKLDASGNAAWQKTYGGSGYEGAHSIQQTSDGGYIVAGHTHSFSAGWADAWVLKLDSSGNAAWQKTYGDTDHDAAHSIQQTSDGGYIVAGYTHSFGAGRDDAWVLKLDASGNAAWQKTYGGSHHDVAHSIQQTSDGGYIVAGYTRSFGAGSDDAWVLKLDASGNAAWQKTYGGSGYDFAHSIQQTSDGGYILAGYTDSFGAGHHRDMWVLKLDTSGNAAWQKTYGGSGGDSANSIQQISDGGYIVAGNTRSFGAGNSDAWILKLDASGNAAWQKTYGGSGYDFAHSIQQTSDGGYILAGNTHSFGAGYYDTWVLKLEADGVISGSCPGGIGVDTYAVAASTSVSPRNSTATAAASYATVGDTDVVSQDSSATRKSLCDD
jgi:uncharacterized delta-60 repeat protein